MERIPQDVLHYHILPRCAIDTRLELTEQLNEQQAQHLEISRHP